MSYFIVFTTLVLPVEKNDTSNKNGVGTKESKVKECHKRSMSKNC